MKTALRNLCVALVVVISSHGLNAQQMGDTFSSANSSKTANLVYVHADVDGFASVAGGNATGLLVELMSEFEQYVSTKYGITVTSRYVGVEDKDFKRYLDEVQGSTGGVFGLSNTSIKEERKAIFKFSPAFLNNISVLISHNSFATLSNMSNIGQAFQSKVGYAVPSTTNHARMIEVKRSNFPSMSISPVNSSREILENIAGDPDGFGFSDIHYYLQYLKQGKPIKRHPVGDQAGDQFGIIMPMNSDWEPILAEFLNGGFLKSSKYREIVISNLGKGALRMMN